MEDTSFQMEDTIIQHMTYIADNIVQNGDDTSLNILIFHILVGSYIDDSNPVPRERNHQFPILAEKIINSPLNAFSINFIKAIGSKNIHNITINQQIILIDSKILFFLISKSSVHENFLKCIVLVSMSVDNTNRTAA